MGEEKMSVFMRDYIYETTKKLVDNPSEVEVDVSVSTKSMIVQIKVAKEDCGKIIGRQGRTIEALKVVCMAIKNTQYPNDIRKILLEVLEDETSDYNF
jgi:predicted RNA-binding protein YlqC (UPF0109 family)